MLSYTLDTAFIVFPPHSRLFCRFEFVSIVTSTTAKEDIVIFILSKMQPTRKKTMKEKEKATCMFVLAGLGYAKKTTEPVLTKFSVKAPRKKPSDFDGNPDHVTSGTG